MAHQLIRLAVALRLLACATGFAVMFPGMAASQSKDPPDGPTSLDAITTQNKCERLALLMIFKGSVTDATFVKLGTPTLQDPNGEVTNLGDLPAFCRVSLHMKPVAGSNIRVELWLPASGWNGRFLATGNGGGAGRIRLGASMQQNLKRGFAVANTDLGTSPTALSTVGQPQKWVDFGHRANHEMARVSKQLIRAFYGVDAHHSYFAGCSTGGQQGLVVAQKYPEDFDGIVVAAPGHNRTHLHTSLLWNYRALTSTPYSSLSKSKAEYLQESVLRTCAGKDGGLASDPFLTDPRQCKFDLDTLAQCKPDQTEGCLTSAELEAAKKLYSGAVNPRTGERIHAGMPIGAEASPLGPADQASDRWRDGQLYFFNWTFGQDFKASDFDFDHDMDRVDARLSSMLNANNPDLSRFSRRGGKILWYHGLLDSPVPFDGSVDYFENVVEAEDGDLRAVQDYLRLFLVPGMYHCSGGTGAWNIGQDVPPDAAWDPKRDALIAVIEWVEKKRPPLSLVGSAFQENDTKKPIQMQRPICSYPMMPSYVGGDPSKVGSFQCLERPRGGVQRVAERYLN